MFVYNLSAPLSRGPQALFRRRVYFISSSLAGAAASWNLIVREFLMAVDLIGLASQYVTPQLIGQIAGAAGLDSTTAEELVGGAIPSVVASLASAAATAGGAQKIADAVSNADPDLLTKLSSAAGTIQNQMMTDGAAKLGALIGANGLSGLAAALSTHSGADQSTARLAIGAVAQALIGGLGQQDPSLWSDGGAIGALFASQKNAIAAALPTDLAKSLGASGLLQGLGAGAAATASSAPAAASQARAASASSGFPVWAIVVIVLIVLAALYWVFVINKEPKPAAATAATIHYAASGAARPLA
jgi:Bacterial protein of unknown function (DUF937)